MKEPGKKAPPQGWGERMIIPRRRVTAALEVRSSDLRPGVISSSLRISPFTPSCGGACPSSKMGVGAALAVGIVARPTVAVIISIMGVATYVHRVVDDPELFPLQPSAQVIPLIVIALSLLILWRGAGAWSKDMKATSANQ